MHFLPPDEHVDIYNTAFNEDLLGRKKVSKRLSDILERIEDPLVVALDGRWGTGKSYFLKRWVGAHRLQNDGKALTIYFDAFAHDYLSDPLISLVAALSQQVPEKDKGKLEQVRKVALRIAKPLARIGLAVATYGASEILNDIGDAAVGVAKDEAGKVVDDFWEREEGRQTAMAEFRAAIETLAGPIGSERTPLIIVIDELDRCRPDYALEVLEVIKHFFAVPHVHFVLGANIKALENSVKARYGAEIDATAYLQKFLSFTVNLPDHIGDHHRTPAILKYADHIGRSMEIPKHLLAETRTQLRVLGRANPISIRDVGKVMSALALLPNEALNERILPARVATMITLIVSKVIRPDIFAKLLDASITDEELVSYTGATGPVITQMHTNGKTNTIFDREVLLLFATWTFILNDGVMEERKGWPDIAKWFDQFGEPINVKQIPLVTYENWISAFKAT